MECRACQMIQNKMRGRRPKHVTGCVYIQNQVRKMDPEMQKMIKQGYKEWQRAKKEHALIKRKYHRELKKRVKELNQKKKVLKAPKAVKEEQIYKNVHTMDWGAIQIPEC